MACAIVDLTSSQVATDVHAFDFQRIDFRILLRYWVPGDRITITWPAMLKVEQVAGASLPGAKTGKLFTFVLPGAPSPNIFTQEKAGDAAQWHGAFRIQGSSLYRGLGAHALDHPAIACASHPTMLHFPPPPPPVPPPMPSIPPGSLPQSVQAATTCDLGGEAQINLLTAEGAGRWTTEVLVHPTHWRPSWVIVLSVVGLDDLSVTRTSGAEPVLRHLTRKPRGSYASHAWGRLGGDDGRVAGAGAPARFWNGGDLVVNELSFLLAGPATIPERQLGFLVQLDGAAVGAHTRTTACVRLHAPGAARRRGGGRTQQHACACVHPSMHAHEQACTRAGMHTCRKLPCHLPATS